MTKDNIIERFKRVSDVLHETQLIMNILSYARSGHASRGMVEGAIELVEKHIRFAHETGDQGILEPAKKLKDGLERALVDGIASLRMKRGPTQETLLVEMPLVKQRTALGHRVRRQMRCRHGIIDIFDLTADQIIECKVVGTSTALGEAAGQLQRYKKSFPGTEIAIAVLNLKDEAIWLADLLKSQGIAIIEVKGGIQ